MVANAALIKRLNRQTVLKAIRERGPISRVELATVTGLSQPAVTAIVRDLIRQDLVREVGTGQSSGGRPPILLAFNPSAQVVLGAALDGEQLVAAAADLDGAVLAEESLPLGARRRDDGVRAMIRLLDDLLHRVPGGSKRLAAIGVGVPGITHSREGTVSHAPSLGWWQEVPLRDRLQRRFKVPVAVENDVNLMVVGEHAQGAGRGAQHLVLMHIGTGIGAGIILGGTLFRGAHDAAGEVGYLPFGPMLARQPGDYGLFEQHYSARGLAQRLAQCGAAVPPGQGPVAALVQYARLQIPWAQALLDDALRHWAYAVAAIACILNPERVLLAGDAVDIGEEGLARIREQVAALVPVPPEVQFATLGRRGGLVGAITRALHMAYQDPAVATAGL